MAVMIWSLLIGISVSAIAREETVVNDNPDSTWAGNAGNTSGKSIAVVIGISDYIGEENDGYRGLPTTRNDVDKMIKFLRDDALFDIIHVLTDESATKQKIEQLMTDKIPLEVGPNDRFLFYWSGHGDRKVSHKDGKERSWGYLPLAESKKRVFSSMVSMDDLSQWNDQLSAHQTLFVLDSCLSGLAGVIEKSGVSDALVETLSQSSRQLITAGTAGENAIASERWDGSLFTDAFISGGKGEAKAYEGVVTLDAIVSYVRWRVNSEKQKAKWTKTLTPQFRNLGEGNGTFFFKLKAKVASKPEDVKSVDQSSSVKGSSNPLWFAVVGTFRGSTPRRKPEALATTAAKILKDSATGVNVELYETKNQSHRIITIGGPQTKEKAAELARLAKSLSIAHDALPRESRSWQKIADCTDAGCKRP